MNFERRAYIQHKKNMLKNSWQRVPLQEGSLKCQQQFYIEINNSVSESNLPNYMYIIIKILIINTNQNNKSFM